MITGDAHARWSEGMSSQRMVYTGNQPLLYHKKYVVGGRDGKLLMLMKLKLNHKLMSFISSFLADEIVLEQGTFCYPFQCYLPPDLPTSLEGTAGYIRYTVIVVLDAAGNAPNMEFQENFTALRPLNLNNNPVLRVRLEHGYLSFPP